MFPSRPRSRLSGDPEPPTKPEPRTRGPSHSSLVPEKDTLDVLVLPDGRNFSFSQFGLATGRPVFFCHGLPGSRVEAGHLHEAAVDVGARIIATDRPGVGLSSPQPGRTLLNHPRDLEQLAAHLELQEYAVLVRRDMSSASQTGGGGRGSLTGIATQGVSGGGPYALACAAAMPRDKLRCVAVVCGLGPPDIGTRGAGWFHRLGLGYGWRLVPRLSARLLRRGERLHLTDEGRLKLRLAEAEAKRAALPERELGIWLDREIVGRMVLSGRQAYAQGIDWVGEDGRLACSEFGFRLEDVRKDLPVMLWYGKQDTFVSARHGEQIAERLGKGACLRIKDDTHASIFFRWRENVLEDLVRKM